MEELNIRYKYAQKAFGQLAKTIEKIQSGKYQIDYDEMRDSLIQRFEFCVDTFWKLLKLNLVEREKFNIEVSSPKAIFRLCADTGLITKQEFDLFVRMVEDRNMTSHTYNGDLAQDIASRIPNYYIVMKSVLEKIRIELKF